MDRLDRISKRGAQGKKVRAAIVKAMKDGSFDAGQIYSAIMAGEQISSILPADANHDIKFVEKLLIKDANAAAASGNANAKQAQGERIRPTGEINRARFAQLMREGLTADQAFVQAQKEAINGTIRLSLAPNQLPYLRETSAHEAFHVLQDYYGKYDPQFAKLMNQSFRDDMMITDVDPTIRRKLEQAAHPAARDSDGRPVSYWQVLTSSLSEPLSASEAQAYAFGSLVDASRRGTPMSGLKPAFARFVNFARQFFTRMGNALRGDGFQTPESLLGRVAQGDARRFDTRATPTDRDFPQQGAQLSARRFPGMRENGDHDGRVSQRVPTAKKATEDALAEDLPISIEVMARDPEAFARNASLIEDYVNYIPDPNLTTPEEKVNAFKGHVIRNLLWLYDNTEAATRDRSRLWYVGSRKLAEDVANQYGMSDQSVAGVMAVLSPQKDWFQNLSLGMRTVDIYKTKQNYVFDKRMRARIGELFPGDKYAELRDIVSNKSLAQLRGMNSDLRLNAMAMWVRTYDQVYNSPSYMSASPEGELGDPVLTGKGAEARVAWGSMNEIGKAISIIEDGSRENISLRVGGAHKVRNFFNNILAPDAMYGDVTIDTHAVAAALLRPLSGKSLEVAHGLGSSPGRGSPGASSSSITGAQGLYGIYADAYREAADARGVLPREMQSITWEAIRGLFRPAFKRNNQNVDAANQVWQNVRDGIITEDQAREQVRELGGGISAPSWETGRPSDVDDESLGSADGSSDVSGNELPGTEVRPEGAATRRTGGRGAGTVSSEGLNSEGIDALRSASKNVQYSARGDSITDFDVIEASGTRAKAKYSFVADLKSGGYMRLDVSIDGDIATIDSVEALQIKKNPFRYKTDGFGKYSEGVRLGYSGAKDLLTRMRSFLRVNHPNIDKFRGVRVTGARMRSAREVGEENNVDRLKMQVKASQLSARNVGSIGNRVGAATPADIRNKQFEIQYTQTSELMNRGLRKIPFVGKAVKDTTSEDLIILMQDRMLPLGRMVDAVRKGGGTVVDASDIYMTEELYHGRAGAALDERAKKLYKPVFDAIKRLNVTAKDVDEYLEARHAPERNAFVKSINEDPSKGAGITNQEAAAIMKRLAPQKAKLDEVAKLVDAIVADTNKTRFNNGLTPDYSTLNSKTKFKYYVPLRGFAEEDIFNDKGVEALRARTGQGFKIKGKEDRSITGRQSRASNILGNVILQNEEAVIRAEKNKVGQALLKMIRDNPTETAGFARILEKAPVEPRIVNGKVKLVSNGMYKNRDDVMVVKEGGNEVAVEIYDERLAKALTGASGLGAENTSVILNAMGKLNRYLAQVNTTLNPEFVISNFARDLQTANINIKQYDVKGMGRKIISDVPSALAGARAVIRGGDTSGRWAKAFEDFRNAGGTTEYLGMRDIDGKVKQINEEVSGNKGPLVARPFKTMIKLIEDYNSVAENGIRLSTFQALRDMGVSDAKAAQVAKNLTVNFNKAGQNRVLMNSLYLFYNASIQGSMAMVNAMARSPRVRKYVAGIITAGVMHDVINSMMSGMDDDERKIYDKIPEHVLERNYVLMDPFGLTERGYYAFPMPYGFNAFFNMGRNLARVSRGEGDAMKTGTSILMGFVEAFNPMGGTQSWLNFVSPTITDPLVDLATNRNFANRPISPDDRGFGPPTPDSQRFWSNTFPPYVTIAQWLNQITGGTNVLPGAVDISPNTIGYLMNYATGAAGAFAERVAKFGFSTVPDALTGDLEEFEVRDVPFVRKLYGNVTRRNNLEDFMENSNRIAQIQKEFTEAEKFGQGERMMQTIQEYPRELAVAPIIEGLIRERQKITREMSQIRRDPNLDDQTRRDMLRVLGQQSDLFVGQVNRIYNTQVRQ
jgi:hypothetical protein